jgi:hypothetical protein
MFCVPVLFPALYRLFRRGRPRAWPAERSSSRTRRESISAAALAVMESMLDIPSSDKLALHRQKPTEVQADGRHAMEYKVLTERDSRFSGSFDPESLETTLNSYATEGWRVVSGFTAASVWKSAKSEIMIVLERVAA